MTGTLPRNDFRAFHWLGDGDFVELMRCSVTAEVTCGAYLGTSISGRQFRNLIPTTADLGFTARLSPPRGRSRSRSTPVAALMPT